MKSLLVTLGDFIFTMICAGVKQLKRQIAALLGINYDSLPNSCASSPFVAEKEMGISLTITMISAGTIMRALRYRHLITVLHPVPKFLVARVMVAASESQSRGGNLDFCRRCASYEL